MYICIRSEKATNWGRRISGGVTSTILGLVASNIGLIASEASTYTIANQYLFPLCLPLFLFSSDLRRTAALASTTMMMRHLLPAFTLGSGTCLSLSLSLLSNLSPSPHCKNLVCMHPSGRTSNFCLETSLQASFIQVA